MTVISSKEFAVNQEKYFDMAMDEEVCVKRGENLFYLMHRFAEEANRERVYYEPDEDFYRSITIEELRQSVHEHIHKLFSKNECIYNA